jgi:hypothetical protein
MVQVITGLAQSARDSTTSVVVRIVSARDRDAAPRSKKGTLVNEAQVVIRVSDATLEKAIAQSVAHALEGAMALSDTALPSIRFKTERRLVQLEEQARLRGKIAVIAVTPANAKRLSEYVTRAFAAGALGAQLVWDGVTPSAERAESYVFAVLELARTNPKGPPVMLTRHAVVLENLMLTQRTRLARYEEKR